jgi:hypothetical protein
MLSFLLLVGAGATGTTTLALVESPTRLTRPRRAAKIGDTIPITETLRGYNGDAQDLPPGSSVVFTLVSPDGTVKISRQAVTILQTGSGNTAVNKGGVRTTVARTANDVEGVSTYEFEATLPDGTVLTFPDDSNGELTVMKQLG